MARILIIDFVKLQSTTSAYAYRDEEALREHLRRLTQLSSPEGLSSVPLARFSDETDASLAARGAVIMGYAADYDSALLAVK